MNLDHYAERIGFRGSFRATEEVLRELHFAHARAIPFENLDIHRGVPIRLEFDALVDKLVKRRRGGYCFEQNGLFLGVLRVLGFRVRPLAARVLYGKPMERPRTHMALLVEMGDQEWLADVGFGTHNLLAPLPLEEGAPREIHGETFRFTRPGAPHVDARGRATALDLEAQVGGDAWTTLYRLSFDEQVPADWAMANWFTSTHPESMFVQHKIVSRVDVGRRWLLFDDELKVREGARATTRHVPAAELPSLLANVFGLAV